MTKLLCRSVHILEEANAGIKYHTIGFDNLMVAKYDLEIMKVSPQQPAIHSVPRTDRSSPTIYRDRNSILI